MVRMHRKMHGQVNLLVNEALFLGIGRTFDVYFWMLQLLKESTSSTVHEFILADKHILDKK